MSFDRQHKRPHLARQRAGRMRGTSSLRPCPSPRARPRRHGPARPSWPSPSGLWQDAGNTGALPNRCHRRRLGYVGWTGWPGAGRPAETQNLRAGAGHSAGERGADGVPTPAHWVLAEPGQAGEATAAPESNVILLGQEPGPGPSAATPERAAAAPGGRSRPRPPLTPRRRPAPGPRPPRTAAAAEAAAAAAATTGRPPPRSTAAARHCRHGGRRHGRRRSRMLPPPQRPPPRALPPRRPPPRTPPPGRCRQRSDRH